MATPDVSWNMAPPPDTAPRSTVVALVGADSDSLLSGLSDVPALVALSLREDGSRRRRPAADRGLHALRRARRRPARACGGRLGGALRGARHPRHARSRGRDASSALFDAGVAVMPDYYLVAGPELIEGTWRHWWLGALAHRAPSRVLPVEPPAPPCVPGCAHSPHPGRGRTPPGSGTWPSTSPTVSGCAISPAPPDAILLSTRAPRRDPGSRPRDDDPGCRAAARRIQEFLRAD